MTASGYVHPRSLGDDGQGDYMLEVSGQPSSHYARWIAEMCDPHLGRTVLDVGAGHGGITANIAPGREVTALDSSPSCVAALEDRFAGSANVRIVEGDLTVLDSERFDSILLTNVLEHIRDDSKFLAALKERLLPGGTIVVYVPALNGLYTAWDRKIGHYRRYSKKRLAAVCAEAGLEVTELRYANLFAIPAWPLTAMMVGRERGTAQSLDVWDRFAVPVCRYVESKVVPPIGLNLLCVSG